MEPKKTDDFFPADNEEVEVEVSPNFFFVSKNRSNLFTALAKAQGQIEAAHKGQENPYFKSKYADIHDIGQAVKKPLADNNLFYMQMLEKGQSPREVAIRTLIGHESGEYIDFISSFQCKEYENVQKVGAVVTYGKRYALAGALGVTSTERMEDGDGNVIAMPEISDEVVKEKLQKAADQGLKEFNKVWKDMPVKDRKKMSPTDLKDIQNGAKKPGMVRGKESPTNRV
jgi:hypothetical protein